MNLALRPQAAAPPLLRVRRPLVRPPVDTRQLLALMRAIFVRRTLGLLAVLVVLCLAHVWLQLQATQVAYQLSAARALLERLDHERSELKAEVAALRDPGRLAERARRELGMVEPQGWQLVEVE